MKALNHSKRVVAFSVVMSLVCRCFSRMLQDEFEHILRGRRLPLIAPFSLVVTGDLRRAVKHKPDNP